MKKIGIIILICSFCTAINAQRKVKTKIAPQKELNIKIAVKGNPENLSFLLGAEKMFKQKKVTLKCKTGKEGFRIKQNLISLNATIGNHATFENNLFLNAEWIKRTTFNNKFFVEGTIGFGYGKAFANGAKTYIKQTDGTIKRKKPDNDFIGLNFMYGGGYNLEKKYLLPVKVYAKGGISAIYYHKFAYVSIIGEIGLITDLSIFSKIRK